MGSQKIEFLIFSAPILVLICSNTPLVTNHLITIAPEGEETKDDTCHYIYLCKKRADADKVSAANWPTVSEQLKKIEEDDLEIYSDEDNIMEEEGDIHKEINNK